MPKKYIVKMDVLNWVLQLKWLKFFSLNRYILKVPFNGKKRETAHKVVTSKWAVTHRLRNGAPEQA